MRRSSDNGGTEPLAALVAVAVVCSAVSLYAGLFPVPTSADQRAAAAERLLDHVYERTTETGVVRPGWLERLPSERQWHGRWRVNVTVETGPVTWRRGPSPPAGASNVGTATRQVSVRQLSGRVRPGRLRVVVW